MITSQIHEDSSENWGRPSFHHLMGIGGLVLALTAFVAIGGWKSEAGPRPARGPRPIASSRQIVVPPAMSTAWTVIYLVGSQAELELAREQAGVALDQSESGRSNDHAVYLIVASAKGDPASDLAAAEASRELMDHGVAVHVVDLRGTLAQ